MSKLPPRALAVLQAVDRLDKREKAALEAAVLVMGGHTLPRPHVREQLRDWFWERRHYLYDRYKEEVHRGA